MPWTGMITDGLRDCSGTRDCSEKVLRCPDNTATSSQPCSMWSILRWVVSEGFSVDARLIKMQRSD